MGWVSNAPAHPPRLLDVIGLLGFIIAWLVPVTYHGLTGLRPMPFMPLRLLHLTNISCLFTRAVPSWPFEYLQVLPKHDGAWETLRESDYFDMPVFGNRTRFSELTRSELGPQAFYELTVWVQERYAERHGSFPVAVRVLRTYYSGTAMPAGRWRQPPLEAVPEEARAVVFTFYPGQRQVPPEEEGGRPTARPSTLPSPR
jgi:hypothetical protein